MDNAVVVEGAFQARVENCGHFNYGIKAHEEHKHRTNGWTTNLVSAVLNNELSECIMAHRKTQDTLYLRSPWETIQGNCLFTWVDKVRPMMSYFVLGEPNQRFRVFDVQRCLCQAFIWQWENGRTPLKHQFSGNKQTSIFILDKRLIQRIGAVRF